MDCAKCLEENRLSIEKNGYSDSYVGKQFNCERHKENNTNTIHQQFVGLKWTDGLPYERTRRMKHQIEMDNNEYKKSVESSAYTSSLNHDENTWEILNQSLSGSGFKVSNKREELGDKLANRDMVQQIGFNPFLGQSSYIDDISVRDQFLKPMNTTLGDKLS